MALLCPIMSSGTTGVTCVQDKCALWDNIYGQCSYLASAQRITTSLEQMLTVVNEIKSRI